MGLITNYMRQFIFLIVFIFSFSSGFSQSVKDEKKPESKELSDYEFLKLEKGYAKMLASETHSQAYQHRKKLREKKNGLVTPDHKVDKKWLIDEAYTKKWLAANLKKTKFKSVDEAYSFIWKSVDFVRKQYEENTEVYALLKRASKKQRLEVFRQESDYIRNQETKK